MATIDAAPTAHLYSYDDVMRMYEVGILGPEQRVELLDGVLIDVSPPGPRHDWGVARLNRRFVRGLPDEYELRPQLLLHLPGGSFVLPDLMVVQASLAPDEQPRTAFLVIEIAHTSQQHDRAKAARYAAAGVEEYWLADAAAGVVVVYREPGPDAYRAVTEHREGTLTPLLGVPEVPVTELLGS